MECVSNYNCGRDSKERRTKIRHGKKEKEIIGEEDNMLFLTAVAETVVKVECLSLVPQTHHSWQDTITKTLRVLFRNMLTTFAKRLSGSWAWLSCQSPRRLGATSHACKRSDTNATRQIQSSGKTSLSHNAVHLCCWSMRFGVNVAKSVRSPTGPNMWLNQNEQCVTQRSTMKKQLK